MFKTPYGFFDELAKQNSLETKDRSWPEDFEYENGQYANTCCHCKKSFYGHKRRVTCKKCNSELPVSVSILQNVITWQNSRDDSTSN